MIARLVMFLGVSLLLGACAAYPDYGYRYGYASNAYCGWGGPCYSYGPYYDGYGRWRAYP